MEHLDLDVGMGGAGSGKPQELTTIQPVDMTSPMGASKIPHQPVTPNINVNNAVVQGGTQAQKQPGAGQGSNFIMVGNQRQSPMNKQHENNFMVSAAQAKGYQKNGGSIGPQASNGFKNFQGPQPGYNYQGGGAGGMPH